MPTDELAQRKAQTTAVFDLIAPHYDSAGVGCFAYFGHLLVARIGIQPDERVLDIATGRGAILVPTAERTRNAIGIDLSQSMLDAARVELQQHELQAELRQ